MSTWMITGTSRGFGRLMVDEALAAGDSVIATARRPEALLAAHPGSSDQLLVRALDLGDEDQARDVVADGVARFGGIDVLVNNAGYGIFGAVEELSNQQVHEVFETNVFGLLNVTRAVLPTLRAQGSGHVVNVGSLAGIASSSGRGIYSATKFAVEALTEALHAELAPLGIKVTVVEPGTFRTDFLAHHDQRRPATSIEAYAQTAGALQSAIDANDGKQLGDPVKAVQLIRALVAETEAPLRFPLGSDCIAAMEAKAESLAACAADSREMASSTDFPLARR